MYSGTPKFHYEKTPEYLESDVKFLNLNYLHFLNTCINPVPISPAEYITLDHFFRTYFEYFFMKYIDFKNISIIKADLLLNGTNYDITDKIFEDELYDISLSEDESDIESTSFSIGPNFDTVIKHNNSLNSFVIIDNQSISSIDCESISSVDFFDE
mgnify:CR=1 FL=1